MKVLITGGAGFIGCNAAARALERGDEVAVLDDLSRRGSELNLEWLKTLGSFAFLPVDVRDYKEVRAVFAGGRFDVVLHLAAQVAVTTSVADPRTDFEINALGTFNLLEAARESGHRGALIFSSTNKVYGNLDDMPVEPAETRYRFAGSRTAVSEAQPLDFHSPYGCSKGAADQYVRDYARMYGLKTVVMRQSCIYGPRQFGIEDQGWVAWFIIALLTGRRITVFGDGRQVRDVLFMDDLLDSFDAAVRRIDRCAGKMFNVGGGPGNTVSLREFLKILEELSGRSVPVSSSDWRPGDQKIYVSDIARARDELDWAPRVGVREGVARLYRWVEENLESIRGVLDSRDR
ncbi:MAG TPA: SDR family NAD(P)-dependent oxidoreductase [bacterium]|nr:SDR family NAD(P)-dependent oxidoreductase [bacterium]